MARLRPFAARALGAVLWTVSVAASAAVVRSVPVSLTPAVPGLSLPQGIGGALSLSGLSAPAASLSLPQTGSSLMLPAVLSGKRLTAVAAPVAAAASPIAAAAAPLAVKSPRARPDSAVRQANRAAAGKSGTLRQAFDGAGSWAVPGSQTPVDLSEIDPGRTPGFKEKGDRGNHGNKKALKALEKDLEKLDRLQRALYAEGKRSVLVVVQGMDTSGKDGTIRYVLAPLNPQGVRVTSFKKPTAEEARHGFLWRIRKALPGQGMIGVFNRSQYEDILVPSVLGGFAPEEIQKRFEIINRFEKGLTERGVEVIKFFLHISKAEQKRRLQDRLDDPEKRWKFSPSDLESRKKWDQFMATYGKILAWTSTPWAPWYVIPADNKWFRNQLIGRILRERMEAMGLAFPEPSEDLKDVVIPD